MQETIPTWTVIPAVLLYVLARLAPHLKRRYRRKYELFLDPRDGTCSQCWFYSIRRTPRGRSRDYDRHLRVCDEHAAILADLIEEESL